MDDKLPKSSDSFNQNNNDTISSSSSNSEIQIISSKPSVYRQQSQDSTSSYSSEHDITNVSSINEQHQHSFHLQSMKNVLLGFSATTSRSSSPVRSHHHHQQQQLNTSNSRYHDQQSYVHNYENDHPRIRLTSSAINRQRQQQRIERENLKILERLQRIRPSRSLKREELLSDYNRQMGIATHPTDSHFRPSDTVMMSSTSSVFQRNQHSQSRLSSATQSSTRNSIDIRPISASSQSSSVRRRIWNDRWQQEE